MNYDAAKKEWFERMGSPTVDKARFFVIGSILGFAVIAMSFAIASLAPLKTVVPYTVRITDAGAVSVDRSGFQRYTPGKPEITYFLSRWVKNLISVDYRLTESNLKEAWSFTAGKASSEFTAFLDRTRPIESIRKTPQFSRVVEIRSLNFVQDRVAMVRVAIEDREGLNDPKRRNQIVTLHFEIVPVVTEEQIMRNPLGLFVSHFEINDEFQ